jgi:pimeloyl-ACP methyl ester carboxylesterase
MRGFDDSDRPGRYSYAEMRGDVLALLDVIGADRADLVGHSMGAPSPGWSRRRGQDGSRTWW